MGAAAAAGGDSQAAARSERKQQKRDGDAKTGKFRGRAHHVVLTSSSGEGLGHLGDVLGEVALFFSKKWTLLKKS